MLHENLTVKENLLYGAHLRLSRKGIGKEERIARVNEMIDQFELKKCANTLVGKDLSRGISNGEKKRTSIAIEYLLSPSILFLDEPTTGKGSD